MTAKPRYRVRAGRTGQIVTMPSQNANPLQTIEIMRGVVEREGSRAIAVCTVNRDGSVGTAWSFHENANVHELAGAISRLAYRFQREALE